MRARRVPALLPEQPAVTVVQHSRACACTRARRVPAPLPGWLAATVALHSRLRMHASSWLLGRLAATARLHSKV